MDNYRSGDDFIEWALSSEPADYFDDDSKYEDPADGGWLPHELEDMYSICD